MIPYKVSKESDFDLCRITCREVRRRGGFACGITSFQIIGYVYLLLCFDKHFK